jgi:tetratricopeptide (TPR) repeat protein
MLLVNNNKKNFLRKYFVREDELWFKGTSFVEFIIRKMFKRKQTSEGSNKIKQAKITTTTKNESELWKRVFSDAREAFAQKKFKESIALFTRALALNPAHPTLLDCRAASYEKIDQLDLALRDAKSIIQIAPTESRGYLRAGKVLALQQKYDTAMNVYKRALTKVDPSDSRYQQIALMQTQVKKKANPPPIRDFMKVLPYDVTSLIFSMLSFDRRVQCTGVCKRWRNFALSWSGMWRDLDFGDRKVPLNTIKKYLGYAKGRHVRRFAVANANLNTMKKILQLLIDENCQYIEMLGRALNDLEEAWC